MKKAHKIPLICIITYVYLSFLLPLVTSIVNDSLPYVPSVSIFLNCGDLSTSTLTSDGRNWTTDIGSNFVDIMRHDTLASFTLLSPNASRAFSSSTQDSTIDEVPYMSARISSSQFTYNFIVPPGPKYVRLHFYPASISRLDKSKALFSVTAGPYRLLHNFSPSLTSQALKVPKIVREFFVNVDVLNQMLNLTFTPTPNTSDAYAFVNGIEIVSMPPNLYYRGGDDVLPLVGSSSMFYIENTTALEMVYRLNIGGEDISPKDDTGMFREWTNDEEYLLAQGVTPVDPTISIKFLDIPNYTAPSSIYRSARTMGMYKSVNIKYNLTWLLPVDSGFKHLVRLHFCEFQPEVTRANDREFHIFINNQTAEDQADVIIWSGGNGIPVYRDYVVWVNSEGSTAKQNLSVALQPNDDSRTRYSDAILNGLEVLKLSDTRSNLAGPNPMVYPTPAKPLENSMVYPTRSNLARPKPIIIAEFLLGGMVVLFLICYFVFWRRRGVKHGGASATVNHTTSRLVALQQTAESANNKTSLLPSDLCRSFLFAEIKSGTNNFQESMLIGAGGFGNVYKGYVDGGATPVAIKRGQPTSHQGVHEFQTEIELLSKLRHLHLVSLIGYCEENQEMILVYDYIANGTLRSHLYKTQKPPLLWKQRLNICIGAARGLHYLHTCSSHAIIHRDVKTTNILLDENWVAKVSDFGLSKMGPSMVSQTHVSTLVKGSFGYLDPEYCRRQKLTEKSDVYSFGVVLFEVLCARLAVNSALEEEQVSLAEWALLCHERGTLDQIIDPHLRGQIEPDCFIKFTEIAKKCLAECGNERPPMSDVLWNLELALQLQENIDARHSTVGEFQSEIAIANGGASVMIVGGRCLDNGNSDLTPGAEFSEIIIPVGR